MTMMATSWIRDRSVARDCGRRATRCSIGDRTVRLAPAAPRACIDKPRSLTDNPRRRFREEMMAVVRCTVDIASFLLQTARFNTRNRTMGKGRIEAFSDGVIAI